MNPADAPEQNKREWEAVPDSCHGEDKSGQMMMKGQRALRTVVRVSTIVWTVIASVALGVFWASWLINVYKRNLFSSSCCLFWVS